MFINWYFFLKKNYPQFVGGVFKLELFLPEEYPMAAPKVSCFNFCEFYSFSFHVSDVLAAFITFHCNFE